MKLKNRSREFPLYKGLPDSEGVAHFTSALPPNKENGIYGFRQIKDLFFDKGMKQFELRQMFVTMDINKDEIIDDKEWIEFFNHFLNPFQECD